MHREVVKVFEQETDDPVGKIMPTEVWGGACRSAGGDGDTREEATVDFGKWTQRVELESRYLGSRWERTFIMSVMGMEVRGYAPLRKDLPPGGRSASHSDCLPKALPGGSQAGTE